MVEKSMSNRWFVVVGAILTQLCLGAIYAWSVFTKPLVDAGWTKGETQIVFSISLATFAIFMVIAGRLIPKVGPQKLAFFGGLILGIGYFLAGLINATNFWVLLICIGIIGGAGIGLAYVVPIAVGMRWFPDKKGLITGLAVAGFGFGSMFWVKLASEWGHMIANLGLGTTFIVYGVIFLIAISVGAIWMVFPPKDWKPEGWNPEEQKGKGTVKAVEKYEFNASEMIATPQFYMIFITFIFSAGAGLMCVGLMKLFPMKALMSNGLDEVSAGAIAGTAMAIFFSLANGIGRIAWGSLSDKIGRQTSITIMMVIQGIVVIMFQWMAGYEIWLYIGAMLIGFNFGGNFALFPTITADTFGTKNLGQNYGWVFLAYGVGGIFGPILGGKLGDLGNFQMAFSICGILCLIAGTIIASVKPPMRPESSN